MAQSRRGLIKALGVGVASCLTAGNVTVFAKGSARMPAHVLPIDGDPAVEAFLAQFDAAWRPLDLQLRFVLRLIYGASWDCRPPPSSSRQNSERSTAGCHSTSTPVRRRCR